MCADPGAKIIAKAPQIDDSMSFFDMLNAAKTDSSS